MCCDFVSRLSLVSLIKDHCHCAQISHSVIKSPPIYYTKRIMISIALVRIQMSLPEQHVISVGGGSSFFFNVAIFPAGQLFIWLAVFFFYF